MALWTPQLIDTALWLDASDASTITEVSGAVSEWRDKSGNIRHATQNVSTGARPVILSAGLNGLNVLNFNPSKWMMFPRYSGGMLFVVTNAIGDSWRRVLHTPTSNTVNSMATTFLIGEENSIYAGLEYGVNDGLVTGTASFSGYNLFSCGSDFLNLNGLEITTSVAGNTNASTSSNSIIGATVRGDGTGATTDLLDSSISEIVFVPSQNIIEKQYIEGYLAWKWGIQANLPTGHLYELGAPQPASVSGIVSDSAGLPVARTVRAYDRATGALLGTTTSDATTGAYEVGTGPGEVQRIVLDSATEAPMYNDLIDRVIPE